MSEPLVDEEDTNPFASVSEKESKKTSTTTSGTAPAPTWDDEEKPPKEGHVYFFLCCDTRRASIVVNALFLFVLFVGFAVAAAPKTGLTLGATSWVTLIFTMMVSGMSIYGAVKLRVCPALIGVTSLPGHSRVGAGVDFELPGKSLTIECRNPQLPDSIAFAAVSIVWQFLMIYAEGALLVDMKRGFMKPETYSVREEYSVCCKR